MNLPKIKTEAVEVYNQTGLKPKQLLEQRDALVNVLLSALPFVEGALLCEDYKKECVKKTLKQVNAAIAKARVE